MIEDELQHLRVLIANERRDRLELLAQVVVGLGHDVIAREIYVKEVGAATERERPDVALVGLGLSSEHALELINEIVREASCPVIALLTAKDPAYVREAAKRGVFAYIVDGDADELQSAIDITLQRFAEYQSLQGAFGRRALIEQAKGILMARHALDADRAFEMLRGHSQHNGRKLVDVAQAIVDSHLLLLAPVASSGKSRACDVERPPRQVESHDPRPATCGPVGGLNSLGRRALPYASRTCGHWDLQPLRRSRVVGQEALPRCFVERCSVPGVEVVRQVSELRFDALREAMSRFAVSGPLFTWM